MHSPFVVFAPELVAKLAADVALSAEVRTFLRDFSHICNKPKSEPTRCQRRVITPQSVRDMLQHLAAVLPDGVRLTEAEVTAPTSLLPEVADNFAPAHYAIEGKYNKDF